MKKNFMIMEQTAPIPQPHQKFRLVELLQTSEGIRWRLTSHVFATLEGAKQAIERNGDQVSNS